MEPRPHERGNIGTRLQFLAGGRCFNGATSSRTWKPLKLSTTQAEEYELQWSHVLTNVETWPCLTHSAPHGQTLQWSHVLTNVETSREHRPSQRRARCFN